MLLQTNSYIVPKDKRAEHARLLRRFRQTLLRLGCDHFEVYEQVGANWNTGETTGRFVQIMRFRDRKHQLSVQSGERTDPQAQQVVREFCDLINFPYQQQQGLFAVGFYTSFLKMPPQRTVAAQVVGEETVPGIVDEATVADSASATSIGANSHSDAGDEAMHGEELRSIESGHLEAENLDPSTGGVNGEADEPSAEPVAHGEHADEMESVSGNQHETGVE